MTRFFNAIRLGGFWARSILVRIYRRLGATKDLPSHSDEMPVAVWLQPTGNGDGGMVAPG
jgi:hypothetical protein